MILHEAFLTQDYYETMGLTPAATQIEVEEAFKQQSVNLNLRHPLAAERIKAAEQMLELTQAFEALSNPILRSHYDLQVIGRHNLPVNEKVDILFKEGIRAWRKQETDLALRYLKEVSHLYPHRALYRVHLAIAYAEKQWMSFTESELETALRLDPDFKFAKETVAKLLFKLPDKQSKWYNDKLLKQIGPLAAAFVLTGVLLAAGVPQGIMGNIQKYIDSNLHPPKKDAIEKKADDQLPEDMRKELDEKQKQQGSVAARQIPFFENGYKPEGRVFDYTKLEAKEKVFYPDQNMIVITYKDGSILTYKPAELKGWLKQDGQPVMVTANNELIPSPTLPLKLPGNVEAKMDQVPAWMFPEYGNGAPQTGTPAAEPPPQQAPAYNPYGHG